jgi:hypothetical protein
MPILFISHSDEDRVTAELLAQHLRGIGYEPETQWITPPDVFMILLSPDALTSERMQQEYSLAQTIPVLVLHIRSCEVPAELSQHTVIDFRQGIDSGLRELYRHLLIARGDAGAAPYVPTEAIVPMLSHIQKPPHIDKVIITTIPSTQLLVSIHRTLNSMGYQPKSGSGANLVVFRRGSHRRASLSQSPKDVMTEVTIQLLPNQDATHTRLVYNVTLPPAWGVNSKELAFWTAEIELLETILSGKHATDDHLPVLAKAAADYNIYRVAGCLFVFALIPFITLAIGTLPSLTTLAVGILFAPIVTAAFIAAAHHARS